MSDVTAKMPKQLAILGAVPAFTDPLHVNQPNLGHRKEFLARIEDMLDRRWFTNDGPYVAEFESRLAQRIGTAHCVAVSNGTTGLMLVSRAAELTGEVLVPSFTFVATAHALSWQGLEPVFCDIDPETWNIDPAACEKAITPETSAILGVHLFGRPCDAERLGEIARAHGLRLFFDAAHAFGCSHEGRAVGGLGDAEIFSFHSTKVLHTFEGGAIATDDDELADRLRILRNFGFRGTDDVAAVGINAKMPEFAAAMGLSNLDAFDGMVEGNRATFDAYEAGIARVPGLRLRGYEPGEQHNWQYIVIEVVDEELGLSRDELLQTLEAENVLARRYFYPGCHRAEPYRSQHPSAGEDLPSTEKALERVMVLPGGQGVAPEQAALVCDLLAVAAEQADHLRHAIAKRYPPR